MTILGLAWRSLKQRRLASILTAVSIALGVALTIAVVALRDGAESSYRDTARGYDCILGPTHGSTLDIVLNTMFHVGDMGGTIPWDSYEEAKADEMVKYAVPYAVGDMLRGHHVVGTTSDMFRALMDPDNVPLMESIRGRVFKDGKDFEAVIGGLAAANTGLTLGDKFRVTHGVGMVEHAEEWLVVGVMKPTGTPADRGVFVPIETFYEIEGHQAAGDDVAQRREERAAKRAEREKEHGHAHDGDDHGHAHDGDDHGHAHDGDDCEDPDCEDHGHAHDGDAHGDEHDHAHAEGEECVHGTKEELGLSAVGIRLKSPILRLRYVADVRNDRGPVQAVIPQDQIRELFDVISPIGKLLTWIVALMIVVAGVGTMVSLYNTIAGRRREIAILRAVGARPRHVFSIIVTEALLLCILGGLAGILIGHGTVILIAPYLLDKAGVFLSLGFGTLDVAIAGVLVVLGLVVGLLPAWQGLRTPVAENLHPTE
ncbi:MAG: ABC transporter permease [Planctomycetota bacterium]|nr:ABC transporter permease [Planctomycetota bacterium]